LRFLIKIENFYKKDFDFAPVVEIGWAGRREGLNLSQATEESVPSSKFENLVRRESQWRAVAEVPYRFAFSHSRPAV
jgi:hypothetical protein